MTNLYNNTLKLDHGIESVSHHRQGAEDLNLASDHQPLPPPSQSVKEHANDLLKSNDTESYLSSMLEPMINDLSLLTPTRFHSTLRYSLKTIQEVASEKPEMSRTLKKATFLLSEEIELRELSQMYRSTLYQG